MHAHESFKWLLLPGILWLIAILPLEAAAEDSPSPGDEAAKVVQVWQTSGVLQMPILRLAIAESNIDETTKRKASESLLGYESELHKLIADAEKNPANAQKVLEKVQTFQRQQSAQITALFTKDQWEEIGKKNNAIALQLTGLSSDPASVLAALDKAEKLTAPQIAKIQPSIVHLADQLKAFKANLAHAADPKSRAKEMIDGFDSTLSAAIDVRSQIREALNAEQLKDFDSGMSYEAASNTQKPKDKPVTKPDG